MLYALPEDIQWYVWSLYYKEFVIKDLIEEIRKRDATIIQNIVKSIIDEAVSEAVDNLFT